MADINIEYVELTDENINDINKYININSFDFYTYFTRLCREIKDKNNYLYYTFNAIEILDNIFYFGLNNKQISFVMENDDNYLLIFNKIENPLVKFKILSIIYNIHDDKNNSFKSKNIGKYINFLKTNWSLYIPYFTDNNYIYTNVFTNLISLLKKSGSNESYEQLIEKLIDEYCNLDISDYKINIYSELFVHIDKKYHERLYHKLIVFINNILDNNIEANYSHAEQASITARKFCQPKSNDYWKTYEIEASVYIKQAEYRTDSKFVMAHYYEKAYQIYQKIDKNYRKNIITEDKFRNLKDTVLSTKKNSLDDMMLIKSPPIDIKPIISYTEKNMTNKSFNEAVSFFAHIQLIGNYDELLENAKEALKNFPLQNMLQKIIYNDKGQKKDSIVYNSNNGEYEMHLHNIIQTNQTGISLKTYGHIYPALNILLNEHGDKISKEFIYGIIRELQLEKHTELLIVEGLYYGFKKEFVASIHILIPQIENILRNLILPLDNSLINIDKDGKDTYKGLNTILSEEYREILWQIIGPDIYIDLKTLLDDEKGGLHLRNDLSHGLLSYDACNSACSIYLWWFIFTWFYYLYNRQKDNCNI